MKDKMGYHSGGNKCGFADFAPTEADEVSVAESVWFLAIQRAMRLYHILRSLMDAFNLKPFSILYKAVTVNLLKDTSVQLINFLLKFKVLSIISYFQKEQVD